MRRWIRAVAVGVAMSMAAVASAAEPVCLLPLGDSITAGVEGGWRKPLVERLEQKYGLTVTTVGSVVDPALPAGRQAHEGHPGWRLDQLTTNLIGRNEAEVGPRGGYWLTGGHDTGREAIRPTVVTVMAGINDLNQMFVDPRGRPMSERSDEILSTLQSRMRALVGTLPADATLLLGGCTPYANGLLDERRTGATKENRERWAKEDGVSPEQELGVNHWVIAFNRWIRDAYVPELKRAGRKVEYVDVYAKFILPDGSVRGWSNQEPENSEGPAGYGDYGLHPNRFGYGLMAEAWAEAIAKHAGGK